MLIYVYLTCSLGTRFTLQDTKNACQYDFLVAFVHSHLCKSVAHRFLMFTAHYSLVMREHIEKIEIRNNNKKVHTAKCPISAA